MAQDGVVLHNVILAAAASHFRNRINANVSTAQVLTTQSTSVLHSCPLHIKPLANGKGCPVLSVLLLATMLPISPTKARCCTPLIVVSRLTARTETLGATLAPATHCFERFHTMSVYGAVYGRERRFWEENVNLCVSHLDLTAIRI